LRVLPLGEPGEIVVADDLEVSQPDDYGPEEEDETAGQDERAASIAGHRLRHGVRTRAGAVTGGPGSAARPARPAARRRSPPPHHGRSSRSPPVPDHGGGLAGARHEMIKAARSCPSRFPLTPGVTCCGWPRPARRTPARGGSGPERAASTPGAARPNRPARTREATPAPTGASGSVPPAACARIGGSRARRRPAPAAPGATRSRARRRRARIPDTAPRPWPGAVVGHARERSWWTGPGSAAS